MSAVSRQFCSHIVLLGPVSFIRPVSLLFRPFLNPPAGPRAGFRIPRAKFTCAFAPFFPCQPVGPGDLYVCGYSGLGRPRGSALHLGTLRRVEKVL